MVEDKEKGEAIKEKEEKIEYYRMTAIIVGVLFITATATAILGVVAIGSTLEEPVDLTKVSENENQVVATVILELILAVSVMAIGFLMFPILKRHDIGLASGYVVLRLTEAILIIIASISLMSLLTMGHEYVDGTLDASSYEPSITLLLAIRNWSFIIGTMIFLGLGGLFLNYLLYKIKLVPSWLSIWGFIGGACVLLYGLIALFDLDPSILAAPIAVQEMVFAVWLIAKGFNPPVINK